MLFRDRSVWAGPFLLPRMAIVWFLQTEGERPPADAYEAMDENDIKYELETVPEKYENNYSEDRFWDKLSAVAKVAGIKVVYAALLLYYVLKNPMTPRKDRNKILGALGYLILPLDLIPDWIPLAGFTDDLAALTWAIYTVAKCITPEVKDQAAAKCHEWFGDFDPSVLEGLF